METVVTVEMTQSITPDGYKLLRSALDLKGERNGSPQISFLGLILESNNVMQQERIQLNANHPLAESMGYIELEGM